MCRKTPARTKSSDSDNSTKVSPFLQLDPKSQLILHIRRATAVYLWENPSCKSIPTSRNASKFPANEGPFISAASAAQSMAWRPQQGA